MRPVRLTMQALGPYAGREVVDFRDAVAAGLFGIYGQTGAGKSTIFSAMTFALFGEAAKSEQDTASLRSDLADPALPTEVEFVFDIAARRYVIRRRPEQMRPKQRGAGETRDAHEAWLFDATGLALEEIAGERAGKILAEKKVGAVREAVTDLLGYGAEQFRQIVLLPQGKFETFLAARTDARLAILRELFDVSLYRRLAAKLKDDAATAERRVSEERKVSAGRLRAENFETMDELVEAIAAAECDHAAARERESEAATLVAAATAARDDARQVEDKFKAAAVARQHHQALLARADEIAACKARLDGAERARSVLDVERYFLSALAEVKRARAECEGRKAAAEAAAEAARLAAGSLAEEQSHAGEIEALRSEVQSLDLHRRTLTDAQELQRAEQAARKGLETAKVDFDAAEERVARLKSGSDAAEATIKRFREIEDARGRLTAEHGTLITAHKSAEAFEKAERATEQSHRAVAEQKSAQEDLTQRLAKARSHLEAVEAIVAQAQALHLAATLAPGEACPVCGSSDHPAPATGNAAHPGPGTALREARAACDTAQDAHQLGDRQLGSAEATLRLWAERVAELERPERPAVELKAECDELAARMTKLGPLNDIAAAQARLAEFKEHLTQADIRREERRATWIAARENEGEARARLLQALSTIPETLRDRAALEPALKDAQTSLDARRAALETATKAAATTSESAVGARKEAEGAEGALAKAQDICRGARQEFEARLGEAGLSEAEFQSHKAAIATIAADRAAVEEHARHLAQVSEAAERAGSEIAERERPDLDAFERALGEAVEARERVTEERARKGARYEQLGKLRADLVETAARLQRIEAETAPLRDLAALFNAQNLQKVDLETFAIGAMFDQVLMAANQRLGPMTASRYTLEREVETGGGRTRSGLGIRVFDIYTGKSRATATLSGGETFIAALALALGLSDVVESASGKVRLDTIFIDEGFGSLDTENESGTLEKVLQVLTNLVGETRSIGLISHVPHVQEAIPNGFYIRQREAHGSRVEARAVF